MREDEGCALRFTGPKGLKHIQAAGRRAAGLVQVDHVAELRVAGLAKAGQILVRLLEGPTVLSGNPKQLARACDCVTGQFVGWKTFLGALPGEERRANLFNSLGV